jgi:hypothetical protein
MREGSRTTSEGDGKRELNDYRTRNAQDAASFSRIQDPNVYKKAKGSKGCKTTAKRQNWKSVSSTGRMGKHEANMGTRIVYHMSSAGCESVCVHSLYECLYPAVHSWFQLYMQPLSVSLCVCMILVSPTNGIPDFGILVSDKLPDQWVSERVQH